MNALISAWENMRESAGYAFRMVLFVAFLLSLGILFYSMLNNSIQEGMIPTQVKSIAK